MKSSIQLDFEAPIAELEKKMEELKHFSEEQDIDVASEIDKMEEKIEIPSERNLWFFNRLAKSTGCPSS